VLLTTLPGAQDDQRVMCLLGFDEQIKGLDSLILVLRLAHIVYQGHDLWLRRSGKAIQFVDRFVLLIALLADFRAHLAQCCPRVHRTFPNVQLWGIHFTALDF